VRLALVGREPDGAELFVADVARRGRSHLFDDISALLDAGTGFVPMRIRGGMRLLAKHAIAWIAVRVHRDEGGPPAELSDELADAFTLYDRQHRVEIELAGGAGVTGLLLDSAPADRPRVVDHLNRPGAFLRVWTPDEHVLVNKHQIVSVTELGAPEPT
jgi:hypothetical protein